MGKIICEKHGEQGIVLTCEHVRREILTGTPTIEYVVTATHEIGAISNETVSICVGYCNKCAKEYGLAIVDGTLLDSASELSDRTEPVCSRCFEVLKESLNA